MERLAIVTGPVRLKHRGDLFLTQHVLCCAACGNQFGSLSEERAASGERVRSVSLAPGYHMNAAGVYVRHRSPRRPSYIPDIDHSDHLMLWIKAEKLPITVQCSWKLCKERNLIARW